MDLIEFYKTHGEEIAPRMWEITFYDNNRYDIIHLAENSRGPEYGFRWFHNGDEVDQEKVIQLTSRPE